MSNPVNLELQQKISVWRQRAATGDLTLDEMREAIRHLREGRVNAAASAATTKRKAAAIAVPKAADLLSELDGL